MCSIKHSRTQLHIRSTSNRSATNHTWTVLGFNLDICSEKPVSFFGYLIETLKRVTEGLPRLVWADTSCIVQWTLRLGHGLWARVLSVTEALWVQTGDSLNHVHEGQVLLFPCQHAQHAALIDSLSVTQHLPNHILILHRVDHVGWDRQGMRHACERKEMHTNFCWKRVV
jgi:hypothetical protein